MAILTLPSVSGGGGLEPDVLTALPEHVLAPYKAGVHGNDEPVEGTMQSMDGRTIIPTNTTQIVSCADRYMKGNITVPPVSGLVASVIKAGAVVGGVTGTMPDYSYLAQSHTAFLNGTFSGVLTWGIQQIKAYVSAYNGVIELYKHSTLPSGVFNYSINFTPFRIVRIWAAVDLADEDSGQYGTMQVETKSTSKGDRKYHYAIDKNLTHSYKAFDIDVSSLTGHRFLILAPYLARTYCIMTINRIDFLI